ncbi:transglutaminase family protein [Antrihabitans cavernicola]|uniref:Transglutaminase family protein n=1 Tax=Antrihabitans cavernicola TaxID=2495913 RepID=A0A5A7SJU1_9NOCA|nr:transglutaminase family protein [Spelaeibacter cavernicola]KAA0024705.1 transglutaminase family protein [Spelaeibacter cavernicola]
MGIKVALEHRTTYTFDRLVAVHPHVVRLRPAPHTRTPIEAYTLKVEPAEHFVNWQQDVFGNFLARLVFPERAKELSITVGLIADMEVINPLDFFIEDFAEHYGFEYPADLLADLEPYLRPVDEGEPGSGPGELVKDWVRDFTVPSKIRTIEFLARLNREILDCVGYTLRMEVGVQTPDHTLRAAIGSCRDSAWLMVSILREMGLAARFVSGYLVQLSSDVKSLDGPSGPEADFTDLHAWTEVYIPGAGWIGLDPTSGLFAGEGHIPLSATPHPSSSAPISGSTGICESILDFANVVTRIHEDPRVTLPYTETQWTAIQSLGAEIDRRMVDSDVALTMGGEPTFVSIDNQEDPEWTTAADGPHKRRLASELASRLKDVYAPTGFVQRNQGKWYPGEPLPRWQIGLYWRTDGGELWNDPELLADPWSPEQTNSTEPIAAQKLAADIAEQLGLPDAQVRPAYEDPIADLATLLRQPDGDPPTTDLDPTTDSVDARQALIDKVSQPVRTAAAYVLPLHRAEDGTLWESADWKLRRGRIVLRPGDSPAGLRLPLDSISWRASEPPFDDDPTADKEPIPDEVDEPDAEVVTEAPRAKVGLPTTALVVEVRDGIAYVFLPPVAKLDHFVDLISVVESAAEATGTAVVLEGYAPPPDPRIETLTVTPDPGVIEVNMQPTSSFAEQSELLANLYEQARRTRLGTESFDNDGTHGGTGGGNHITLGGRTPAESPLLRRPDLLVSLLTYWQRHPSLSYLFSGRFIGTTSQAPRADEGRQEALYELEIAFAEIDRLGSENNSPWQVDRALRHLLTDITGNTHRAEFCIDKLYSPDSARGRLGLLELRGFEMPPHHRMAMVQSLLVRSLVSRFWDDPLKAPLIRHGANLHGRYLLPHYIIEDITAVAADLRAHGIDFDTSWLDPFTEFRFPRIGTAIIDGAELELRGAIEPWNVLGEESSLTGTARYVDSSVERLQVRLAGADTGRYILTCNGFPVPLMGTDKSDVQVAGVRYRAWQPPSALHPSLTVDGPLVFDLVDTVNGRSRGGCTYHVSHPGGRSYDGAPVNAVEAESRRNRRFEAAGYTPGPIDLSDLRSKQARLATDVGAPGILDLRRARSVLR